VSSGISPKVVAASIGSPALVVPNHGTQSALEFERVGNLHPRQVPFRKRVHTGA
jgi:hypothetical protein